MRSCSAASRDLSAEFFEYDLMRSTGGLSSADFAEMPVVGHR